MLRAAGFPEPFPFPKPSAFHFPPPATPYLPYPISYLLRSQPVPPPRQGGVYYEVGLLLVKADPALRSFRWWSQKGLELAPDDPKGVIVPQKLCIHLGEFFQNVRLRHEQFPLLDKSPHDTTLS